MTHVYNLFQFSTMGACMFYNHFLLYEITKSDASGTMHSVPIVLTYLYFVFQNINMGIFKGKRKSGYRLSLNRKKRYNLTFSPASSPLSKRLKISQKTPLKTPVLFRQILSISKHISPYKAQSKGDEEYNSMLRTILTLARRWRTMTKNF